VRKGELGINQAALQFSVHTTTLKDWLAGRVVQGRNVEPSNEEEKELVEFLVERSKIGYGKTRREKMKLVEEILERKEVTFWEVIYGGFDFYKGGQS